MSTWSLGIQPAALFSRLLVFLSVIALFSCGIGAEPSSQEYVERGLQHREKGNMNAELIELRNAVRADPVNALARFELGKSYIYANDGASAEKELRKAIELGWIDQASSLALMRALFLQGKYQDISGIKIDQANLSAEQQVEYFTLLGYVDLASRQFASAQTFFDKALKLDEKVWEARVGKAQSAVAVGDLPKARGLLEELLDQNGAYGPAWSLLAQIANTEGDLMEAEKAYGKAIEHKLFHLNDLFNRALIRIARKNTKGAEEDILAYQKAQGYPAAIAYLQGALAYQQGSYKEAKLAFQEVLKIAPDYLPAIYKLGLVHFRLGENEQAEDFLRRYVNESPGNNQAELALGGAIFRNNDFAGAREVVEQLLIRDPDNNAALKLKANIAIAQGRGDEASTILARLTQLEPDSADSHMKMGLSLLMEGKQEDGIAALEKASELDSGKLRADVLIVMSYLRAGEFQKAIEAVNNLEKKLPDNPLPDSLRGTVLAEQGEHAQAKEAFLRAWKKVPGDPPVGRNLARLALRDKEPAKARDYYQVVLEKNPTHLETLIELSIFEQSIGNREVARQHLSAALKAHPEDPRPRTQLTKWYLLDGQLKTALETIQEPGERALNNANFLEIAGITNLQSRRYLEAEKLFAELVVQRPGHAKPLFYLAAAKRGLGHHTDARHILEKGRILAPKDLKMITALAELEIAARNFDRAEELIEEIRIIDGRQIVFYTLTGRLRRVEGKFAEAAVAYEEVMNRQPSRDTITILVGLYFSSGQASEALQRAEAWLQQDPKNLQVRLLVAEHYGRQGQVDAAILQYEEMLVIIPDNPVALNNLANLYLESDLEKAIELAKRANILAPKAPAIADTLGWLLFKNGDTETALSLLREAHQGAPETPSITYHLAKVLVVAGKEVEARKLLEKLSGKEFAEKQAAEVLFQELK